VYEKILHTAYRDSTCSTPAPDRPDGSEVRLAVEDFALRAACDNLRKRNPNRRVELQPRNHPGYDVVVGDGEVLVGVKGTQNSRPNFFLTEGERLFIENNHLRYRLIVVYAVNLASGAHAIAEHAGSLGDVNLKALQWTGVIDC
jgi:hypothetical protein